MNKKALTVFIVCVLVVLTNVIAYASGTPASGNYSASITPNSVKITLEKIELKNSSGEYVAIFSGNQVVDLASASGLPLNQPNVNMGTYSAVRVTLLKDVTYLFDADDDMGNGPWRSNAIGPNGSVLGTIGGTAVPITVPVTVTSGTKTVHGTSLTYTVNATDFSFEVPLTSPIVVNANGNADINLKFYITNMMFTEDYDNSNSGKAVVSSNPPSLVN